MSSLLRFARPDDAGALLGIYAQYIGTSITFEYDLPTEAEFRGRIENISQKYPYLVHETDGVIDGYAYAHPFHERAAYQWSAELSVYLDRDARSRGLGSAMYTAVIELLRLMGVRTVYALVTSPNERSDRLHRSLGFAAAGVVHNAGYKNGAWRDVTFYEKNIAPYGDPAPLGSVWDIDPEAVREVLEAYP
mgnify:CR=1 FL=1